MEEAAMGNRETGKKPATQTEGRFEEERRPGMRKNVFLTITTAVATIAIAVVFATPARAQCTPAVDAGTFCIDREGAVPSTYARELFGAGSSEVVVTLAGGADEINLRADFSDGGGVDAEKTATFTFELSDGVRFAEDVGALAFSASTGSISIDQAASTGGARGDQSVSYVVKAESALTEAVSRFTFTVPKLMNLTALGGSGPNNTPADVKVRVTVAPTLSRFDSGNRFKAYPATGDSAGANEVAIARSRFQFAPDADPDTAQTVNININDRTMFVTPNTQVVTVTGPDFGREGRPALEIATLTIPRTGGTNSADGVTGFAAAAGDMVNITARGSFGADDVLFFSTNNALSTTGTGAAMDVVLTVTGTTATSSISLTSIAGTSADQNGNARTLYLVPAMGSDLNRGQYSAEFEIDYAADSGLDHSVRSSPVNLEYSNLSVQGYAYALPRPASADVGNLRLRCESGSTCKAFLDCQDQNGMTIGNFPELSIMSKATLTLNTKSSVAGSSLPMVLEADDWAGRLSCEILSDANLGVQVLTRSGGTLVNNTYISGTTP